MLFRLLSLVHVCVAFPLKCPEPAQWSIRARSHCQNPSKYFCLKNDLINGFSENCTIIDFLQPGRKHVLRGGLDADICSSERFQPWPITFYTNVSTNCIFLKSKCNEEGQVLYGNGNRNTDATCRCDYTRGYDFLKKPRNPCFCIPSEEDCSCYLKKCPDSPFNLAPDYECSQIRINTSMSQCRPIMNERVNSYENQSIIKYVPQENNISTPVTWKTFAGLSTVCSIGLIIVVCISKYYRKVYFMDQPSDVEPLEGQSVHLNYKLLCYRFPMVFLKNDAVITKASHIKEKRKGRSMVLHIDPVTTNDEGEYCLKVACIKSDMTRMTIKPLFKRPLENISILEGSETIFECQTEKENSPIEWFHKGNTVTNNTQHVKMETLPGYIYKLTISQTGRLDGGKYHIKKNGVDSEAILVVKALFKRPLENISILEGSETIFECQTEEENSPIEWFHEGNKVTNNSQNVKMEKLQGYIYKLTIARTSLSDDGKYNIKKNGVDCEAILKVREAVKMTVKTENIPDGEKFQMKTHGIDIDILVDVEVRVDEKILTSRLPIQSGEKNGKESCLLSMVVLIPQIEYSNVDDPVEFLNSQKDKINLKTECILAIKLIRVMKGSVALCVDIPVEKIETDEMLRFVLYWFIQIILQTGVVHLSSTENVDVALILSEDFNLENAAIMENCSVCTRFSFLFFSVLYQINLLTLLLSKISLSIIQ